MFSPILSTTNIQDHILNWDYYHVLEIIIIIIIGQA